MRSHDATNAWHSKTLSDLDANVLIKNCGKIPWFFFTFIQTSDFFIIATKNHRRSAMLYAFS